jgi:nicotinamidase-related amidase
MTLDFNPARTALLTIDLQNDFLHPDGAYGRAGLGRADMAALPGRIVPIRDTLRAIGGTHISAQFTLVPGPGGGADYIGPPALLAPFSD